MRAILRKASQQDVKVSEHAHTDLLSKILQSNIRLGDAHLNKEDPSMVLARWVELQQSVNVLFTSNTSGKTEYVYARVKLSRYSLEVLSEDLPATISKISFPKTMKWNSQVCGI
ncbi:uncharacterized protein [Arachis hypogaea]|uniref:uncharacterized protein isoform X2 n=1 Tax=Arachis hypogaea TaxID=3818 RepID=UPI000DEC8FEA|nr:uncharacterized protein LOC112744397 isoform X2 [Arachis hypogaea]XP_029148184.1 uncharacterized protein LOC112744397 isoform X2 [Arachis hypogaea]